MKKNTIVTIGRQFCSGGSEIGKKLAEKLEIPYYDKVIMEHAAEKHGFSEDYVKELEEKHSNSFLYSLSAYSYENSIAGNATVSPSLQIMLAQFEFIREVAAKGPCVIIGRCADYVLRNNPDVLNVFIHAKFDDRVAEAAKRYNVPNETAAKMVRRTEKLRANYYNFYTDRKWGDMDNFHMTLSSSHFSIDEIVELIYRAYVVS